MKKTTKVLLSAILTIAMCVSVISGATFALFTSEAKTNIAVTAGRVNVDANLSNLQTYSMGELTQTQGTFDNGGIATFTDGVKLDLVNITPGDKVTFDVTVTNTSNVAIMYRLTWVVKDGGLLGENGLTAYVDEKPLTNGTTEWMAWAIPATDEGETKTLDVTIELPVKAGNGYQEKTAEISFIVEAVQANGTDLYQTPVSSADDLFNAFRVGGDVVLTQDITLDETMEIPADVIVNLDLNGKTITGTNTTDTDAVIQNNGTLTIVGGEIENTTTNGGAVINNAGTLTLDDVAITGAPLGATDDSGYPEYAVTTSGKLTIEDGTSITAACGAIAMTDGADVTINGGDIEVTDALGSRTMTVHVIKAKGSNSKLTINDGNFALNYASGAGVSVICPYGATIEIYGGNFTYAGEKGGQSGIFQNNMGYGDTVDVYGGTYNDTTFNGGYYQVSHLADGCKAIDNGDGTWTVGVAAAEGLTTAVANGGTVTLVDDITLEFSATDDSNNNFTVAAGTKAVIDLGGNDLTVKRTDGNSAYLIVEGDLTITGEGNVAVTQINTREGSKLTLGEGVTIETSNSFAINNSGTTVIDGATINHTGTNHAIQNQGNGTLTINDATVTSSNSTNDIDTINSTGGTVIINGGTFIHEGSMGSVISWLYSNEGEIIINGGTFIQKGGDSLASIDYGDAKLTINGGTFDSASYFAQPAQNIVINAGEFKNNAVVLFNPFMYWTIAHETKGYIPATSTATTNADGSITVTVNE